VLQRTSKPAFALFHKAFFLPHVRICVIAAGYETPNYMISLVCSLFSLYC